VIAINKVLDKIRAAWQWVVDKAEAAWIWVSEEAQETKLFIVEAASRPPSGEEFEVWKRIIPYFLTSGVTILIIQASALSPVLGLGVVALSLVLFVVTYKWATKRV
jgi:hypothetical protein